jgi:hypothetical protein
MWIAAAYDPTGDRGTTSRTAKHPHDDNGLNEKICSHHQEEKTFRMSI